MSPCCLWRPYIPHFFDSKNFLFACIPKSIALLLQLTLNPELGSVPCLRNIQRGAAEDSKHHIATCLRLPSSTTPCYFNFFVNIGGFTVLVSMEDVMVLKTGTSMLDFQLGLQSQILS